jgi:hypothetical protein
MRLVLVAFALALLAGFLTGGRIGRLGQIRVRWGALAMVGLVLQLVSGPGRVLPLLCLFASFALLIVFAVANLRVAGFPLILVGILLNLTVIGVNLGMPVDRAALVASGQADTLEMLVEQGGAKHHLAGADDRLLFLGDVIPLAPLRQVISLGDVFTYGGVMWLIVAGMHGFGRHGRRDRVPAGAAGGEAAGAGA